jgi:hypothetical protein
MHILIMLNVIEINVFKGTIWLKVKHVLEQEVLRRRGDVESQG